jgi:uncharacterized protein YggU (UPF0235/DUF167 family)
VDVREAPGGAAVGVRVKPRARPGLAYRDGVLTVSVAAPPVDGRATGEALRALAAALGLPPSALTLRSGATSTRKVFAVRGLAPAEVERRLRGVSPNRETGV